MSNSTQDLAIEALANRLNQITISHNNLVEAYSNLLSQFNELTLRVQELGKSQPEPGAEDEL